ncbi:hypothetical protein N8D56_13200 [Devosia sp. A8/3-2]|nr:hypothetical protein N8D56_13200 [Devosia sp. A8/3-2]
MPAALVVFAVGLLAVLPIGRLVATALFVDGTFDANLLLDRLVRGATQRAIFNTLDTSLFGALLALMLGAPFALLVAATDMPLRKLQGFLLILPLMIAPRVMAPAFMHLLGPSSALLGAVGPAPPPGTANPLRGAAASLCCSGSSMPPLSSSPCARGWC